jgi:endonuclease G
MQSKAEAIAIAAGAAGRWKARTKERERKRAALARGEYTKAEDRERLVKRIKRLQSWVSARAATSGTLDESATEALAAAPLRPEDVTDLMAERVIGASRDFLSIEYFERASEASRRVGRIVTDGEPNGTGFLVAKNIVITNWHVLKTAEMAGRSVLELDYEAHRFGVRKELQAFDLEPDRFFLSDEKLDYALVWVADQSDRGAPLASYGFCPLIDEEGKIAIGEHVNIVQHPEGRVKQVAIRNTRLADLPPKPLDSFFHYEADTERGSSGSPVFNDQWEVVALHHSGVPKTNKAGVLLDADGNPISKTDLEKIVWIANEGIRVSRLVAHIAKAELPPEHQRVRQAVLAAWNYAGAPSVQLAETARNERAQPPSITAAVLPQQVTIGPAAEARHARAGDPPGRAHAEFALRIRLWVEVEGQDG